MSGCIYWPYAIGENGYGKLRRDGKTVYAHRVAYAQARGPIPAGLFILHSCDERACINVDHLRAGSQRENLQEMGSRGRTKWQASGHCENGHAKADHYVWTDATHGKCTECRRATVAKYYVTHKDRISASRALKKQLRTAA